MTLDAMILATDGITHDGNRVLLFSVFDPAAKHRLQVKLSFFDPAVAQEMIDALEMIRDELEASDAEAEEDE
ncbi:hypothetical protein GobsT_17780 [Gemmata obscuriglobus]|uniref:Uncharacterized protein n=1 Tax=Gemmata obscuriglobus TaxID=114 RepID=A0A2Z3HEW5_9BACT|nr:hypothetical protein [Gemmata obscuriglobus]AWM39850.1 hypothetical protein C1280_24465 [Gemmata obscuriglobus]QEG27025.1 hypothetical protein GobsT_17780 [Gemmata obscuriglobus]VTS03368.1 unnamed protein product [Gemmata obscuriglobus UQM 2246]